MKKTLLLMIIDGFGVGAQKGNAIASAKTPNFDSLFKKYPTINIEASAGAVGLPEGQMGNSEVGHTNIGAGRIVYQELTRINKDIKEGGFFKNKEFLRAVSNVKENNTSLHLIGLLSNGGVHSHNSHLYALLKLAKQERVKKVYIHAILDGRDTLPKDGIKFIKELEKKIIEIGVGEIATVMGRYYAMDRDNRWDRIEKAYNAMVLGDAEYCHDASLAVEKSYENNVTDEFMLPVICAKEGTIKANDSVIFFNFRPDRARQLTHSFVDENFEHFKRLPERLPILFVCMTQYDELIKNVLVAFKPQKLENTFGEYISKKGLCQLRIAETEKYAHVTFFFNGGIEKKYDREDRILVSSPKVSTYDLKPEMSAPEVTIKAIEAIKLNKYDAIILNFANCDMVGHTGNFEAAVKAVETVDSCVGQLIKEILTINGVAIITADHGNAEKMFDDSGTPFTAHTTNLVPFCVVNYPCKLKNSGKLSNIAPSMLKILGLGKPPQMEEDDLIKETR